MANAAKGYDSESDVQKREGKLHAVKELITVGEEGGGNLSEETG